jgi:branched-chain amino acid transport system permease protein
MAVNRAADPGALAGTAAGREGWLPWRTLLLPLLIFIAFLLLPFVSELIGRTYLISLATRIMIMAIAAVGLDLILGYGALVSFGHAAFIGIGAYAVGIAGAHGLAEGAFTIPLAILAAGLFALVTGAISLRTRGVYFIMITLAFGQMAYFTAISLSAYGGDDGLTVWSRTVLLGAPVLEDDRVFYFAVLGCLAAVFLLCRLIVGSRFGRVLQGARQSRSRVQAVGFNPYAYQLVAYVISGMIAGLAGALLANQTEFVSPAYMSWQRSGELIVMVVLGGMGTLTGPVLGAAAYIGLEEWLSHYTEHWRLIFGPLLVLIVLYGRGGLLSVLPERYRRG